MDNNKRGRPVLNEREKNVREKYRTALKKKAPEALKVIVEVMEDLTARPVDRLRAAEWILTHCFGNDFIAVESNESDRTIEVRLVSVCGRKKEENEINQNSETLISSEDEKEWDAGNKEIEIYDPSDWDVDEDFKEDN